MGNNLCTHSYCQRNVMHTKRKICDNHNFETETCVIPNKKAASSTSRRESVQKKMYN